MNDTRALNLAVLQPDWRKAVADLKEAGTVEQAIAEIEAALPLAQVEPRLDGPASLALNTALRPIGAKVMPMMNEEQCNAWLAGVTLALSDLPPKIALYGVKKAVHTPMQFLNEVDGIARRFAEEALLKQRTALHRLKMMRAEIERATNPQPRLEAPPVEWTEETVAEANAIFAKAGVGTRYRLGPDGVENYTLTEDEHEAERQKGLAENGGI